MLDLAFRRLLGALTVILVMSALIYALIGLMPGDPVEMMATSNPNVSAADIARLRELYGLDQPLHARYLNWLGAVLQGELGYSRLFSAPVTDILFNRLCNTLILMLLSLTFAVMLAIPLGLLAARKPGGLLDTIISFGCFAGISLPPFWLALLLILLFSVMLGWLPAGGTGLESGASWYERGRYLVLPVMTLTLASLAIYTRYVRAAVIEILRQDFMRTARAKGLSLGAALRRHGLRNALLPLVTLVGLECGTLFSGALVTETMFAWPGMGRLIFESVMGNDYNLALAALLFATMTTLIGNLLADIAYGIVDPRLATEKRKAS